MGNKGKFNGKGDMRMDTCTVGLMITLSAMGCAGKRIPTTFTDMGERVREGSTVYVTTTDGKEVKGRLAAVSGSSMTVLLGNTSSLDFGVPDVTLFRARDPLCYGLLIGDGVGGLVTFALN